MVAFNVFAFDGKHKGEALVRVNLSDINDNSPYFPSPPYVGYVEENKDPGASVMVLQAVDLDSGINAEIVYELEDNAKGRFKIDPNSGLVTTLQTLEKETPENEFTIRVKAINQKAGGNPPRSGTVTATIKVADGNDQKPVFNPTEYRATVREDALPGFFVTKVTATDKDEGPNAALEYTITEGNDPYEFYIDPRTGSILVSGLLDYDKGKKSYKLKVMVADRGNPPQKADKPAFVYIDVLDANDNPPVFEPAEYTKRVSEDVNLGFDVLHVTASDKDTGTNAQFEFSITDGDDADLFAVKPDPKNPNIGIIYTLLPLDRETVSQYNLTITATDTGGLQGIGLVEIIVTDVNDNGPWFIPRYYEATIKAGIAPTGGQFVTILKAEDPDELSNGPPFTFSVEAAIVEGIQVEERFKLSKATDKTASMSAFGTFNRAVIQEWKVQVKAGDSGSPTKTNTTFVYIDVEDDRNIHEPEDGSMTIIVNAYNGKFAGGIIGKAYYKDDDYGGDRNKYTMASQEYFSINEGNGNITAVANIPLGRYTFQVQVEEQKQRPGNFPKTVTSTVTVIVQSVTSAAIKQSVAVQIFKLRKTSFFVGDYYDNIFKILGDGSLIFSIQKAPLNRVPLADQFGVEIFLAVQLADGGFMNQMKVVEWLVNDKQQEFEALGK